MVLTVQYVNHCQIINIYTLTHGSSGHVFSFILIHFYFLFSFILTHFYCVFISAHVSKQLHRIIFFFFNEINIYS